MNLPAWVTDPELTPEEHRRLEIRFRLNIAAAHHNAHASLKHLSIDAGYAAQHLTNCMSRGELPKKVALSIEAMVGQEVFSRAMFVYL